jgi:hypothetical protein
MILHEAKRSHWKWAKDHTGNFQIDDESADFGKVQTHCIVSMVACKFVHVMVVEAKKCVLPSVQSVNGLHACKYSNQQACCQLSDSTRRTENPHQAVRYTLYRGCEVCDMLFATQPLKSAKRTLCRGPTALHPRRAAR